MAHPRTQPMLPGWTPLSEPTRQPGAPLGRWLWPSTVLAAFAAVVAYVLGTDPGPGLGNRSLAILVLAVVVLTILTIRRRLGPLAVLCTLAEYLTVGMLAGLLVLAAIPVPADVDQPARAEQDQPGPGGRQAQQQPDRAATLPPVIRQVVGVGRWLAELWHRADQQTRADQPTSTTRGERSDAAPPPDRTGGPPS